MSLRVFHVNIYKSNSLLFNYSFQEYCIQQYRQIIDDWTIIILMNIKMVSNFLLLKTMLQWKYQYTSMYKCVHFFGEKYWSMDLLDGRIYMHLKFCFVLRFWSNLYIQHGTQIHNPKTKSCILHSLNQPRTPPSISSFNSHINLPSEKAPTQEKCTPIFTNSWYYQTFQIFQFLISLMGEIFLWL